MTSTAFANRRPVTPLPPRPIPPDATDQEIRDAHRHTDDRICVDGSNIKLPQFDEDGNFWD